MSGWLTNGVPPLTIFQGDETASFDTQAGTSNPETGSINLQTLAALISFYSNAGSKTPVAGTRYYVNYVVGQQTLITGISVLIGATGGTDKFIFELHDSTGALVATTDTSGVLVGTANTWQQIPFTAAYTALPGTYYIAVQLNGTTARLGTYNATTSGYLVTGSATGTFGTGASITPPTTYTANLGPMALPY